MKIALISHDAKKAELVSFVLKRIDFFNRDDVSIVSTGTTGKMLKSAGITHVGCVNSGPMGGDAEIASMIVNKEIDGVIFFIDPLSAHAHEVDINMLLRICNVHNTPLATNYKSAHIMIKYFKNK